MRKLKTSYIVEEKNFFTKQWKQCGDTEHKSPASAIKRAEGILATHKVIYGDKSTRDLRVSKKEIRITIIKPVKKSPPFKVAMIKQCRP